MGLWLLSFSSKSVYSPSLSHRPVHLSPSHCLQLVEVTHFHHPPAAQAPAPCGAIQLLATSSLTSLCGPRDFQIECKSLNKHEALHPVDLVSLSGSHLVPEALSPPHISAPAPEFPVTPGSPPSCVLLSLCTCCSLEGNIMKQHLSSTSPC